MTPSPNSSLFLLGTSHQVANLNERESIALPSDSIDTFYRGLQELDGLKAVSYTHLTLPTILRV